MLDVNNRKYNLKYFSELATIVLAITAIAGLVFVYIQIEKFSEQNENLKTQSEVLHKTLIQSYRPLGFIKFIDPELPPDQIRVTTLRLGRKDRWSFQFEPTLTNKGNGILVFIGHIYFISKTPISFRDSLLNNSLKLEDIKTDGVYGYSRRGALLPNDSVELTVRYDEIEFSNEYHLYILALYEDQDGNLYDTESIHTFKFDEPTFNGDRFLASIKSVLQVCKFNVYTNVEKQNFDQNISSKRTPNV